MTISSINSNLAALSAGLNIGIATQLVSNDTTALSSGNRIVTASTDVAALSIGSNLSSQVNILNTALTVSSQGASLLQVADGALAQIQSILQRQQAIAASAQAGSLSNTQRGFLDQEFQNLTAQIDQLSGSTTNFNGVNLLDGSIAGGANIATNSNAGNASLPIAATSTIAVIGNGGVFASGATLTVNGYVLQLNSTATGNLSGNSTTDAAANIAAALNASGASQLANYRFTSNGANLSVFYTGGTTSNIPGFSVSTSNATDITSTAAAAFATGTTVGTFANAIAGADTFTINGVTVTFGAGAGQVAVGANNTATLTNLATFLNDTSYQAAHPKIAGLTFTSDATHLYAYYSGTTSPSVTTTATIAANGFTAVTNKALNTSGETGLGAGSFSAVGAIQGTGLFVQQTGSTATNFGQAVDLSLLNSNAAFLGSFGGTGTIGAITAQYVGGGTPGIVFSVVVGNDTYTTNEITNTTLTGGAPVAVTFNGKNTVSGATEGGSFTLNLQPQTAVTNQTQASQLASAINAALTNVSAYQNRVVQSFNNNFSAQVGSTVTATLQGASLSFNNNSFANSLVSSISVSAPSVGTTDAKLTMVVGGQTYSTVSGIGNLLQTDTVITLVNTANPNQTISLTTGNISNAGAAGSGATAIDLSTSANAAAFQTALSNALGISNSNAALTFQVGANSNNTIGVSIGSATSSVLFGGVHQDVLTQSDATTAGNAVQTALNTVSALRAGVGALEERFTFAQAALQSTIQNEGAAKSNLLDTDVAAASTQFATHQVQLQAGIAILAQANQLQQNLLKLIP